LHDWPYDDAVSFVFLSPSLALAPFIQQPCSFFYFSAFSPSFSYQEQLFQPSFRKKFFAITLSPGAIEMLN